MAYVLRTIVALVCAWISMFATAATPSQDSVLGAGGQPAGASFETLSKACASTSARSCPASDEPSFEEPGAEAASAIPEPEVNALMLGGLGAIVFMALRRTRQ